MSTKEQITSRSVIITGIPDNVNVQEVINTIITKHRIKVPVSIHPQGDGYAVLLEPGTKSIVVKTLLFDNVCDYQGRKYNVSIKRCTEDDIPEDWLTDPPTGTSSPGVNANVKQISEVAKDHEQENESSEKGSQSPGKATESVVMSTPSQDASDRSEQSPVAASRHDQNKSSPVGRSDQHHPVHVSEAGSRPEQPMAPYLVESQQHMPALHQIQPDMQPVQNHQHPRPQMPPPYGPHAGFQSNVVRQNAPFNPAVPHPYGTGMPQQGHQFRAQVPSYGVRMSQQDHQIRGPGMHGQPGPYIGYNPYAQQQRFSHPGYPGNIGFSQEYEQPGSFQQFQYPGNVAASVPTGFQSHASYPQQQSQHAQASVPTQVASPSSERDVARKASKTATAEVKEEGPRVVKVTKLSAGTTMDTLTNYFENTRRSGGGNVENVEIDKKENTALVYFEEADVAKSVLQRESHSINKKQVEVSAHEVESSPGASDDEVQSCTIEVRSFKPGTSDDTIEMYFENKRRSGGGDVKKLERDSDVIYVTFTTAEDANHVLVKKHEVDGKKLEVKLHVPKPCYKNRLLVTNLQSTTTKDSLLNYMEARSRCEVTRIVYGEEPGNALVTFDEETIPDMDKLKEDCKKKPLVGSTIEISSVPIADCIVVQGLGPNTSEETVSYYFESKRSGNKDGSEVSVTINKEERICFVKFEDYKVADAVLSKSVHIIENSKLSVSLYMECLGISRAEDDASWYQQPEAFSLESLDKYKCTYLQTTKDHDLKNHLAEVYAQITWLSKESATFKCTLTEKMPDAVKKAKTWRKDTENCLHKFLDEIIVQEITTISEIWEDVRPKLKNVMVSAAGAEMFISKSQPLVAIVGSASSVPPFAKTVKSAFEAVEEEFDRKKQEVSDTVSFKQSPQLRLLFALGFPAQMMKEYDDFNVVISLKQNEIIFKGQRKDILSCKVNMYERITSFSTKMDYEFSDTQISFLDQKEVKDTVVNKMKGKNLFGVWDKATDSSGLCILSTSDEDALSVAGIIKEVVIEHIETLEPESVFLLESDKWSHLLQGIQSTHGNLVKITATLESNTITIVATHGLVHGIRIKIQEFIAENSIYSRAINLPKPVHRFLITHRESEIRRTAEAIIKYNGKIEYGNATQRVTIRCCKEGLEIAVEELMNLARNVVNKKYTMKRPGIGKYIHSEKIKAAIADTEKNGQCVIEHEFDESEKLTVEGGSLQRAAYSSMASPPTVTGVTQIASCVVGPGRQIDVVMGDMTTMKVDVIVNAANNRLDHVGGLAKAIAVKGGPSIQRESDEYIRNHKNVQPGDAVPTGAGRLPCKMVVHAVGPVWSNGRQNEEQDLKDAVMTSMEWADRKGFKSIVLPALSAGIFGYPTDLATKHIVQAIKIFYELESPNSGLTNVYLVDVNQKTVNHFVAALQDVYYDKKVKLAAKSHSASGPPVAQKPSPGSRANRVFESVDEKPMQQGSITVTLVKGEIAQQKADIIVNSTSNNLELQNGAVSKSVLKSGGLSIQSELNHKYPHGIQPGDIAVSGGGKLHCQKVYHICLPNWNSVQGNPSDLLRDLVKTCLQKASDHGCTSIAFPALGAGNLGYPKDVVSQTMYTAVRHFEQRNRSIDSVFFVVYHGDTETIQAFEQCERKVQSGKGFEVPTSSSRPSRRFQAEAEEAENAGKFFTSPPRDSSKDYFKIDLVKGEINKQKADVIINSANSNLDLNNGAVAKSLLKTGGDTLQQELRTNYPHGIKPGDIAATSGGRLQCKEVYHTCLASWADHSSQKFLQNLILKCLQKASDAGHKSVAFPALGTGNLGYPTDVVARTMYGAMSIFQQTNQSLEEVTIVIYYKDTPIIMAFEKLQSSGGSLESFEDSVSAPRFSRQFHVEEEEAEQDLSTNPRDSSEDTFSVVLVKGEINKQKADIIINSANSNLDLNNGAVAKSLLKTGGDSLQKDLRTNYPNGIKPGDIAVTTGGKLQCKKVYHTCLPSWADHSNQKFLLSLIQMCLQKASDAGYKSVAFPALGTGNLGYPTDVVAGTMYSAMDTFQQKNGSLQEVKIVIYHKDTPIIKAFDDIENQRKTGGGLSKTTSSPRSFDKGAHRAPVAQGSVLLYFFSDDMKNIDNGVRKLEKKCEDELKTREVKDTAITKLTDKQIQKLKQNFDVDLEVDKNQGIVKITGLAADAGEALVEVTTYLRNIEKEEGEAEKATLLSRSIQWSYIEKNSAGQDELKNFETRDNLKLEKKFENKEQNCKVKLPKGEVVIDFASMQGTFKGKNGTVNVIRRDLFKEASSSIFDPPPTWQQMADNVNFSLVDVPNPGQEFNEMSQLFMQTLGVPSAKVHKVRRIQNRSLYQQYTAKRKQLEKQNPPLTQNERRLWHGTSTDAIDSINMHGYNRSYCGKNATACGQGVYFAVNANYSAQDTYSQPDQNGHKYMYLARVLTGVYANGDPSMRVPPPKPGGAGAHDLCDSVVNSVSGPIMYIVFNDTQAYPEYLLTFTLA